MFKKLYLTVDSKNEPNLNLINDTKNKMHEELKNRNKVRTINFYKYASIAACLVVFIGGISMYQKINYSSHELNGVIESIDEYSSKPSINNNLGIPGNTFGGTFDSATSSTMPSPVKSNSFFDKIINFFKNIIQWFKELLF